MIQGIFAGIFGAFPIQSISSLFRRMRLQFAPGKIPRKIKKVSYLEDRRQGPNRKREIHGFSEFDNFVIRTGGSSVAGLGPVRIASRDR